MKLIALTLTWLALALVAALPAGAQSAQTPELVADTRLYDLADALDDAAEADVEARLQELVALGADPVVVVRELDADPDETLEQVEELQQQWVAATGADQDVAVAVLVNREPGTDDEARAGVFVGRTYEEGNVPGGEQEDIVDDALIPSLADGDVRGGLVAGLERLASSIRSGPPRNAFQKWSQRAADSWLPYAMPAAAILLAAAAVALFVRVPRNRDEEPAPTTVRPGDLPPAVAATLVRRSGADVTTSTLLSLTSRGAVSLEPEHDGDGAEARLVDGARVHDELERDLWDRLAAEGHGDRVPAEGVRRVLQDAGSTRRLAQARLRREGWLDEAHRPLRNALWGVFIVGVVLSLVAFAVTAAGEQWWPSGPALALLLAATVLALALAALASPLTLAGQRAALPWQAYRTGLEQAAKEERPLESDAVLPDVVAFGLAGQYADRLRRADEQGVRLTSFGGDASGAVYPVWLAVLASSSSSSSSTTVSSTGAGGGGGAAGST